MIRSIRFRWATVVAALCPLALGCGAAAENDEAIGGVALPELRPAAARRAARNHVEMGIPTDDDARDDYLITKQTYVLSYNPNREVANWVSWSLDASDLGTAARRNDFRADDALPAGMYRVDRSDYLRSGYDRGHLCPSADRTRTGAENSETFFFTNIQPQTHALNRGPWKSLEEYERGLAQKARGEVYIIAGGVFQPRAATIGNGVAVPASSFKIIVYLESGGRAAEVTTSTPVIAVLMPNDDAVAGHPWQDYRVSIDAVEAATGYDFLSAVPVGVQAALERSVAAVR